MFQESQMRLLIFLATFLIIATWEIMYPHRKLLRSKPHRWLHNISLVVFNTALIRIFFPLGAVGIAILCQTQKIGLLHSFFMSNTLTSTIIAIILLDLVIYIQHVLFHKIPYLWLLHKVHHADQDLDVTSGTRFHTIEMFISMFIKMGAIVLFGFSPSNVLLFEIILNAMAMFNHGNIKLPRIIEPLLRLLIVTPDMHRIHHSAIRKEADTNYGFNLSIWDRLFNTYTQKFASKSPTLGEPDSLKHHNQSLLWMLTYPFKKRS